MSAHPDEAFLAILVQRGHLSMEHAQALLPRLRGGEDLDDLLVQVAGWEPKKVRLMRRTRGGEEPIIKGFKILGKLGVGGTAEVFKARDLQLNKTVALKILLASLARDRKSLGAFVREAKMLKQMDHESICRGYGIKRAGETIFAVLDYVEGETLQEILDKTEAPLPEEQALEVILQVAEALEYMHSLGLVHRDVKPGNIMFTPRGRAKLIDLGFCAPVGEAGPSDTAAGTKAFLAPEQALGGGVADLRSDIYSLGATLFQLTVGRLPFGDGEDDDVLRKHVMEQLSSPELKGQAFSTHLQYFIEKMMAKDAGVRYQTWGELIADVSGQLEGKRSADFHSSANKPTRRRVPKRRY
jgi:serine/threonine-protein kinase